jgi:hypothetical protein
VDERILLKYILNEKKEGFSRKRVTQDGGRSWFFHKSHRISCQADCTAGSQGSLSSVELINWLTLIAYSRETFG